MKKNMGKKILESRGTIERLFQLKHLDYADLDHSGICLAGSSLFPGRRRKSDRRDNGSETYHYSGYNSGIVPFSSDYIRNRSGGVLQEEAYPGKAENEEIYTGAFPAGENES